MTPGKTVTFTIWTFVGKGMSLLFNNESETIINAWVPGVNALVSLLLLRGLKY